MDKKIDAPLAVSLLVCKEGPQAWLNWFLTQVLVRPVEPLPDEMEYGQSLCEWFESFNMEKRDENE